MAAPSPISPDAVSVIDDTLFISDLAETDVEVVRFVCESDDPEQGARQCLRVGARALRAVQATVDSHIVEKRFEAMTTQFDESVEQAIAQISQTTATLLDPEDGAISEALGNHAEELKTLLGSTFDPNSTQSVIALFEKVLTEAQARQVAVVRDLVSIDDDDSPLVKLQRGVVRDLSAGLKEVRDDVQKLSEKIAVNDAVASVLDLTTGKGFTYEDVLHAAVSRIAGQHGDLADKAGNEFGSAGTKKGDEVVTLNLDDTHGHEGRFVLEAKNRKLNMRKTCEELDGALANRDASAAIAVFSNPDQAPTSIPFHCTANKAIVVFDADGSDDAALRLAYMWARWVVRRELSAAGADEIDLERVAALIDDARRAIERASAIKRCHTNAKKQIDQAAEQVADLVAEVEEALDAVEAELAEAEE